MLSIESLISSIKFELKRSYVVLWFEMVVLHLKTAVMYEITMCNVDSAALLN